MNPLGLAAPAKPLSPQAQAGECSSATGDVVLEVAHGAAEPEPTVLGHPAEFRARITQPPGAIEAVSFQRSPGELEEWTTFSQNKTASEENGESVVEAGFSTAGLPSGDYDVCVVVQAAGVKHVGLLRDKLIATEVPVVELAEPHQRGAELHSPLSGKVALGAKVVSTAGFFSFAPAIFQYKPSGQVGSWTSVETVSAVEHGAEVNYTAKELDTTQVPDGHYDFRVVPAEAGALEFVSAPLRGLIIDNTAPQASLQPPGSPLSGDVTLSADATDPAPGGGEGAGVKSVTFELARTGSRAFTRIGSAVTVPSSPRTYEHLFHTEEIANGVYDFRVTAVDRAGNQASSSVVAGIEVRNQASPPLSAQVTGVAPPARSVTLLGAVKGSPEQETWAYGFTNAPPTKGLDGSLLKYEAEGNQLVLLRYTTRTGWQIADVLRGANGEPFPLIPANKMHRMEVSGAMSPSGDAWLWFAESSTEPEAYPLKTGVFHRGAGGQFRLDAAATEGALGTTLRGWLAATSENIGSFKVTFHLGDQDGHEYGMLTVPGQPTAFVPEVEVPGPHGTPVKINNVGERLAYGVLEGGAWKLESAPLPKPSELGASFPSLASALSAGDAISLTAGDAQSPGAGWGGLAVAGHGWGLILGHYQPPEAPSTANRWTFTPTHLDALDLSDAFEGLGANAEASELKAEGSAVWIGAQVRLAHSSGEVVARYDSATGQVTNSWCSLPVANHCEEALGNAVVPEAVFPEEKLALGVKGTGEQNDQSVHVFEHDRWTSFPAPGYSGAQEAEALTTRQGGVAFSDARDGWLGGTHALGRWSPEGATSSLTSWPVPDRFTLTSLALAPAAVIPPGGPGRLSEAGALAVGLDGSALLYEPSLGWLAQPVPSTARHLNLLGVAYDGPSNAFAVGQFGLILHYDGSTWSVFPGSSKLTQAQLNAVAFASSGEGWAVGNSDTILHYDGSSWQPEVSPVPGVDITSVAVSGEEVFAIAGGNLITRTSTTGWHAASGLPSNPAPPTGSLRLVAGLPDGGVAVVGRALMLVREASGQAFEYAPQPPEGIPVALSPFREAGRLRAFVSVAPPAFGRPELAGFPPGDGELLRETSSGWQDLSHAQFAGNEVSGDGAVKADPVLAVATDVEGEHGWAVGGYAGTVDAAKRGTTEALSIRSRGWQTASIWRYDAGGGAGPPELSAAAPYLPAEEGTVSFAYYSSPTCFRACDSTVAAQPDVNLSAAAAQMASYASQPGGPAFAVSGGDVEANPGQLQPGGADLRHMHELLAPLGTLASFAALGPRDYTGGGGDETRSWAEAFAESPPPFGSGQAAGGITPLSAEAPTPNGDVHRYYAFNAQQNGGTLRVIVLDNSRGSLQASSEAAGEPGSTELRWLEAQLAAVAAEERAAGQRIPVVVITSMPLRVAAGASDGEAVASLLVRTGVAAVFTASPTQHDERHLVPEAPRPGEGQVSEYEGATMTYQEPRNNGVLWYLVSVNAQTGQVHVSGVPVVNTLALKPLDGLNVARSSTLRFEAIARRPPGSLATVEEQSPLAPGYENYVAIPSPSCGECVSPSYVFSSSDPTIGNFVEPSGPESPYPKLSASGHPIPSPSSGLFCAFNPGTTVVSVTTGLLTYSLPVTVQGGGFGPPCGTVTPSGGLPVNVIRAEHSRRPIRGTGTPPPPPSPLTGALANNLALVPPPPPHVALPAPAPPRPAPKLTPKPRPPAPPPIESTPALSEAVPVAPALLPTPTPPVEPIPPGASGYAQSPSAAERREKAEKEASQSAFTALTPAPRRADHARYLVSRGANHSPLAARAAASQVAASVRSETDWFYWPVGIAALLALLLGARGIRRGPRPRPVYVGVRDSEGHARGRRQR